MNSSALMEVGTLVPTLHVDTSWALAPEASGPKAEGLRVIASGLKSRPPKALAFVKFRSSSGGSDVEAMRLLSLVNFMLALQIAGD